MTTQLFTSVTVYVLTVIVGLCVGSFLNVVIYRVPRNMSLATPPSHCPKCDYLLRWYDNIPVLSYVFLGGKCRKCREPISPRYISVEILNAVLWVLCVVRFGYSDWRAILMCVSSAAALSTAVCIAFIDYEHKIIPDRFQIITAVAAVAYTVADTYASVLSHILAGVLAGVIFYLVGLVISKKVGREALGFGDVKFAAAAGLFLGWEKLLVMMLAASISGSIILIILNGKQGKKDGKKEEKEYPFGPFLTAGFALALLFGGAVVSAYMHFIGLE